MKFKQVYIFITIFFCATIGGYAQSKKDINIVFIGNSITFGGGLTDRTKDAPPIQACVWLQNQAKMGQVDFRNMGVSGRTSVDFLPKTNTEFPKILAAAKTFKNNQALLVFSIKLGTNDSAVKGPNGAPVSKEDYYKNIKTISDSLISVFPSCKIIYQQPIWYSPNTHNRSTYMQEGLDRLQTYAPELKRLVKDYGKTNPKQVYLGDKKAYKFFKQNYKEYLAPEDGKFGVFYLHPNKAGAHILGNFWAEAIYNTLF